MSVVTELIIAPRYVQILMEVSFVDVTVGFSWIMMGLHVMVCRKNNYNIRKHGSTLYDYVGMAREKMAVNCSDKLKSLVIYTYKL